VIIIILLRTLHSSAVHQRDCSFAGTTRDPRSSATINYAMCLSLIVRKVDQDAQKKTDAKLLRVTSKRMLA
jgi:hypothetical protein